MLAVGTAGWIAIALLAPFWWGLALLLLALLSVSLKSVRDRLDGFFGRLESR